MSLEQWASYGWLVPHETSKEEISCLLALADRDIAASQVADLPTDWRLNIAHNAVLQAATAVLAASGYRAERNAHHYRVIQSLEHTIGLDSKTIETIAKLHKKRNLASYTAAGTVSDKEADLMLNLAKDIRARADEWLHDNALELLR